MKIVSIGDKNNAVTFRQAIFSGIPADKTLYVPSSFSDVWGSVKNIEKPQPYQVASELIRPFINDEIPIKQLESILKKALNFDLPVRNIGEVSVLELFHGPTMAFKDIAARCLAGFLNYFSLESQQKTTILVATSGDTGGAVADAFSGMSNVNVVILFPKGRVSKLQQLQLTRVGDNIVSLEVNGVFDDCQAIVKQMTVDKSLENLNITTANSINIGRLLPQMLFYAWAALQVDSKSGLNFIVPSGNFGDVTAGLYAAQIGVPINKILAAANSNDVVNRFLETGEYNPVPTIATLSNAMDISNPNNFSRILDIFGSDLESIKSKLSSSRISDSETIETIKTVYDEYGYLLDPHTAVAWRSLQKNNFDNGSNVILSTASPIKFADVIKQKTGIQQDASLATQKYKDLPDRSINVDNNYESVREVVVGRLM